MVFEPHDYEIHSQCTATLCEEVCMHSLEKGHALQIVRLLKHQRDQQELLENS